MGGCYLRIPLASPIPLNSSTHCSLSISVIMTPVYLSYVATCRPAHTFHMFALSWHGPALPSPGFGCDLRGSESVRFWGAGFGFGSVCLGPGSGSVRFLQARFGFGSDLSAQCGFGSESDRFGFSGPGSGSVRIAPPGFGFGSETGSVRIRHSNPELD